MRAGQTTRGNGGDLVQTNRIRLSWTMRLEIGRQVFDPLPWCRISYARNLAANETAGSLLCLRHDFKFLLASFQRSKKEIGGLVFLYCSQKFRDFTGAVLRRLYNKSSCLVGCCVFYSSYRVCSLFLSSYGNSSYQFFTLSGII